MFRMIVTGTVLALAAPAVAQEAQTAPPEAATETTAATPAATPAAASGATGVAAVVEGEFPVYDADKSGQLDKAEFSKWLLALKEQEMKSTGKTVPATELSAWAAAAFVTADADKSATINKVELTHYLGG